LGTQGITCLQVLSSRRGTVVGEKSPLHSLARLWETRGKCTVPTLGLKPELISQPLRGAEAQLFHGTRGIREFFQDLSALFSRFARKLSELVSLSQLIFYAPFFPGYITEAMIEAIKTPAITAKVTWVGTWK
jgi:hypothetical protein